MIKLKDLIEITNSRLYIMDGDAPMLFISKDYMNPDLINPVALNKKVKEVQAVNDNLLVWLKED